MNLSVHKERLLEYRMPFISLWLLLFSNKSLAIVTETIWPAKPKLLTMFQKKSDDPCLRHWIYTNKQEEKKLYINTEIIFWLGNTDNK